MSDAAVAEAPVVPQETVKVQSEIPAEGVVSVTLAQVDKKRFPNYRTKAREEHIVDLYKSIKVNGQLQPCVGSWTNEGKVGVFGGFCRLEAMERHALEGVIRDYNEANGKKVGDEGFIPIGGFGFDSAANREKIRDAGGEWKEKYDAALKSYRVDFKTMPVEDDADAALKGIEANKYDEPPLLDLCDRIESLISTGNITAKRVGKTLNMSESAISQHRKIRACPAFLRDSFKGDLSGLGVKKPDEQEAVRNMYLAAVDEFERRLSLPEKDPKVISFSHAREFSGAVMAKDNPMTLAGTAKALRDLVCMEDNGKLADRSTPDWNVFRLKLNEAKKLGKAAEATAASAVATPAAGATVAAAPATPAVDINTLSKEQQEQFAAAGAALTAPTAPAAPATPTVGQKPTLSAEDQAKMAEVQAANASGEMTDAEKQAIADDLASIDNLAGPSADDILAGEVESQPIVPGTAAPAADTPVGQMKTKTVDAAPVDSKYKMKAPEKLEANASRFLDFASAEDASPFDQLGYVLASAKLYEAIGLEDANAAVNEVYVNFGDSCNKYLAALEAKLKACNEATFNEVRQLKPKFVRPNLSK